MDRAHGSKGFRFSSSQGYVPLLQAQPLALIGTSMEATNPHVSLTLIFLHVNAPPLYSLSLKKKSMQKYPWLMIKNKNNNKTLVNPNKNRWEENIEGPINHK